MAAGFVDPDGTVRARSVTPTPPGGDADAVWTALARVVDEVRTDAAVAPDTVGVGCGGPMTRGGERVSPLNIHGWRDFPLRSRLATHTGLPVFVDNDAKALALGEGRFGAAAASDDFVA